MAVARSWAVQEQGADHRKMQVAGGRSWAVQEQEADRRKMKVVVARDSVVHIPDEAPRKEEAAAEHHIEVEAPHIAEEVPHFEVVGLRMAEAVLHMDWLVVLRMDLMAVHSSAAVAVVLRKDLLTVHAFVAEELRTLARLEMEPEPLAWQTVQKDWT